MALWKPDGADTGADKEAVESSATVLQSHRNNFVPERDARLLFDDPDTIAGERAIGEERQKLSVEGASTSGSQASGEKLWGVAEVGPMEIMNQGFSPSVLTV